MARTRTLTLIQQNDTHAQFDLHCEAFWRDGQLEYRRAGGFARAATIVQQVRAEVEGACVFVDCGDTIHGTGAAQWTEGGAVVPVLNQMGVDLFTPGNWEFGFGPAVLRQRVASMTCPVLACNVEDATTAGPAFEATLVKETGGVRVGFIGLTSPIVGLTMPPSFGLGLRFTDPVDAVATHVRRLRDDERVDLVVLVSHFGFPQDVQLAHEVEGLDVVLSSHTHNLLRAPVRVGRTVLMQSGFGGAHLGRLDLEVQNGAICEMRHRLIEVTEAIEPDPATSDVIHHQLLAFREQLAEVVGRTATALNRMTLLESTMDNLITDAYLDVTGADVALSHGWRYGAPVPAGDVTVGDLWQMVPTNPEVFTTEMSGAALRELLEANLDGVFAAHPFRQRGGYVMRTSGLQAIVRINNPRGTRIERLDVAGAPVDADHRYVVAAAGAQVGARGENQQQTGLRAIDAMRRYLGRHSPVDASLTHAKVVAI